MNKINMVLKGATIVALFSVFAGVQVSHAAWNNNVYGTDCPTTMVVNSTTGTGKTNYCYPTNVSASGGDTVSAVIYYRNTSPSTAHNVTIRLSPSTFTSATYQNFTGTINSSDNGSVSTSASLNLSTAQTLSFQDVEWYKDQSYNTSSLPSGQSGSQILTSGINLGDIPGYSDCPVDGGVKNVFCHQGWIYVNFTVSSPVVTNHCVINSFTTANGTNSITIANNSNTTLSWNTTYCSNVSINGISQSNPNYGTYTTPNLTSSMTYALTASDSYGNTPSQSVYVTVPPVVTQACSISSFTANGNTGSTNINSGGSVTLAWTTNHCDSVSVAGSTYYGSQASYGSYTYSNVTYGQTYTINGYDAYGNHPMQTVNVTVTPQNNTTYCYVNGFTANGNSGSTSIAYGGTANLNWTTTGCTSVSITSDTATYLPSYGYGYIPPVNGNVNVGPLYTTTRYILTASNASGQQTSPTYVTVNVGTVYVPPTTQSCYIYGFTGPTYAINYGSTAVISWSTSGCNAVSVSGPGLYSSLSSGSQTTGALYGNTTYTLTATDYSGYQQTRSLVLSTNSSNNINTTNIVPITTVATNVTGYSARLNGIVPQSSSNSYVNAYFEYGTSYSLGSQTNSQSVSTYTLMNYYDTIETNPATTYYYRAVVNTNGNITRGDIVSFTTSTNEAKVIPVVVNKITYGTGSGTPAVSLSVTDQTQAVSVGDTIYYTITYKNLSGSKLSNVVINFILPAGVTYRFASQGTLTTNNTVLISLGELEKDASGTILVQGAVDLSVNPGSSLVATATLSFTNPNNSQDSAVAYVINNVFVNNSLNNGGSLLTGFALFGGAFFPTTLLGWIILIGIIIILVLIVRKYNDDRRAKQYQNNIGVNLHDNVHH